MKVKLLLLSALISIALVGPIKANAGTSSGYCSINSSNPVEAKISTKTNNTTSSYVTFRSGVGSSNTILSRVFKVKDGRRVAYTPQYYVEKGKKQLMQIYSGYTLTSGEKIALVLGTQEYTSDIVFYTWDYN